jgi:MFS family permease
MATSASESRVAQGGMLAPLRTPLFRRIWLASLMSNLGFMFLAVGAAWQMTLLTPQADMVALVQTALMLPMMMLSIPAGAVADMYDRRKVALVSLYLSVTAASALAALTFAGLASPWIILGFCFLIGTGMALFNPSWQASVSEQVPRDILPQAVALNAISFNIARSFGPAMGGIIVALAGSVAAFSATALGHLPQLLVMFLWRRDPVPSRLPPERIDRAVSAGIRYVIYSPQIRVVLIRTFIFCFAGGSVAALMPLVARDLLHGTAEIFGLLLGCFGMGAVLGAFSLNRIRHSVSEEGAMSLSAGVVSMAIAAIALSSSAPLTGLALVIAGTGWMTALTLCNVVVQTSAPRWVSGRLMAAYNTATAGGIALGSWFWGHITEVFDVQHALFGSAGLLAATLLLAFLMRMPQMPEADREPVKLTDPEVNLALTGRSGPIVVELDYRVPLDDARDFYGSMLALRSIRHRNGAYDWSIARDIKDPEIWVERYSCPTWHDFLRQRDRNTPDEMLVHKKALSFLKHGHDLGVRRLLERPSGSVRWTENAPES